MYNLFCVLPSVICGHRIIWSASSIRLSVCQLVYLHLGASLTAYSLQYIQCVLNISRSFSQCSHKKNTARPLLYGCQSRAGCIIVPYSKVHGANMGPIWGRQDPSGPHVGPMNFAIWGGGGGGGVGSYWAGYISGLVLDCSNSSAFAMELLQSCTKPSISKVDLSSTTTIKYLLLLKLKSTVCCVATSVLRCGLRHYRFWVNGHITRMKPGSHDHSGPSPYITYDISCTWGEVH